MHRPIRSAPPAPRSVPETAAYPEWAILGAVALATMLAPLNSTMIVVALPRIVRDFGATVSEGGLLVTLYLVAMASCQPVAGKLGDRLGRRPVILLALLTFGVVSVGAALAPTLAVLLLCRLLQAISAGLALPNGVALIREVVPAQRRASRFGLVGSAAGVAAALGPPLGGVLTQIGGWRSMFLINLLLVLPALLIGRQTFPRAVRDLAPPEFDLPGAALLSAFLIALAALLIRAPQEPRGTIVLWAVGVVVLFALFLLREIRVPDPVLQIRLFRSAGFAAGNATIALSNLAMYTTLLAIPILEGERTGLSPLRIGLLLAAMSTTNLLAAPLGGRLSDTFGRRWPTVAGLAVSVPGLLALAVAGDGIGLVPLAAALALTGFGFGLGWSGLQTAVVESVPSREAGMASGAFSTCRYFGSITGTSVLAAVVGGRAGVHDFRPIFIMTLAAAALSTVLSLWLPDRPRQ